MKSKICILGLFFLPFVFGSLRAQTTEDRFWNWFVKNQDIYYSQTFKRIDNISGYKDYNERNKNYKRLSDKLSQIDPYLIPVFRPVDTNGIKELLISANGYKPTFPKIIKLIRKSPKLKNWKITAFEQRNLNDSIKVGYASKERAVVVIDKDTLQGGYISIQIGYEDVFFKYSNQSKELDLNIYVRNYEEGLIKHGRKNAVKKLLKNLLGEYDLEMEIDWINYIKLDENNMNGLYPIIRLRELIDKRKLERK